MTDSLFGFHYIIVVIEVDLFLLEGADYLLALKANQGQLHEDVKLLFDGIADSQLPDVETDTVQTVDDDPGRIETRTTITLLTLR